MPTVAPLHRRPHLRRRRGRRRRLSARSSVTAALVALALVTAPGCGPAGPAGATVPVVVHVVDGDTVEVAIGGDRETVRLIGIDTPETSDPRRPVECFGAEATARTRELLPDGTEVDLARDVEARDRYGRLLAYVYRRSDGLFVNLALVHDGFAVAMTYPPNVARRAELSAAAAQAREAGRGLWQRCGGPDVPAP